MNMTLLAVEKEVPIDRLILDIKYLRKRCSAILVFGNQKVLYLNKRIHMVLFYFDNKFMVYLLKSRFFAIQLVFKNITVH